LAVVVRQQTLVPIAVVVAVAGLPGKTTLLLFLDINTL
jgi:hypothetical protein